MLWQTLESIPSLMAAETEWQRRVASQYGAFKALCLQPSAYELHSVRCPRRCGCNHVVIRRHDGSGAVGVCRCIEPACPDIPLSPTELVVLSVSNARLGRALCKAFCMDVRQASLPVPNTFQFGAWSVNAVPAILTIQVQSTVFRRAVAELAAQLRRPFILCAPTADFLDAPAQAILGNFGAEFFALDKTVVLTERGTLQPTRAPGELFARFTPQPKETDLEFLARIYAVVDKFDTEKPLPPPSLMKVFRLYCMEEMSMQQVAVKCKCHRTNVGRRLKLLRQRIGLDPRELRRLSPHIGKIEESLRDDRAARIDRRAAMEQQDEGEEA